jgi:hypothetical protein
MPYNPATYKIIPLLQNEEQGQLEKIARIYNSSGQLTEEYKIFPDAVVGDACLARFFSYTGQVLTGQRVFVDTWTQALEDLTNPPLAGVTDIVLDNNTVTDGDPANTVVGNLFSSGGTNPITFSIVNDPDNKFQIVGNQLQLSSSAVFADTPYSVTIRATDSATPTANTFDKLFSVDVLPSFINLNSLRFDGFTEYVNLGNTLSQTLQETDTFSISLWVNTGDFRDMSLFSTSRSGATNAGIDIFLDSTLRLNFKLINSESGGNLIHVRANPSTTADVWTHYVITYDGTSSAGGVNLRRDGGPVPKTNVTDTLTGSTTHAQDAVFGKQANSSLKYFDGKLDEISIWDRVLSNAEISEIYNGGSPANLADLSFEGSLLHWWRMGDGDTIPTITDNRGSVNGTTVNMDSSNKSTDVP